MCKVDRRVAQTEDDQKERWNDVDTSLQKRRIDGSDDKRR